MTHKEYFKSIIDKYLSPEIKTDIENYIVKKTMQNNNDSFFSELFSYTPKSHFLMKNTYSHYESERKMYMYFPIDDFFLTFSMHNKTPRLDFLYISETCSVTTGNTGFVISKFNNQEDLNHYYFKESEKSPISVSSYLSFVDKNEHYFYQSKNSYPDQSTNIANLIHTSLMNVENKTLKEVKELFTIMTDTSPEYYMPFDDYFNAYDDYKKYFNQSKIALKIIQKCNKS